MKKKKPLTVKQRLAKGEMRVTKVYLGLYKSDFVLLTGPDEKVLVWARGAMRPSKLQILETALRADPIAPDCQGRTWNLGGGGSLIWMRKPDPALLVHELAHAAFNLMEAKCTPLNSDTEEPFAYLMEYLFANLT